MSKWHTTHQVHGDKLEATHAKAAARGGSVHSSSPSKDNDGFHDVTYAFDGQDDCSDFITDLLADEGMGKRETDDALSRIMRVGADA